MRPTFDGGPKMNSGEEEDEVDHLALARDLVEVMRTESGLSYGQSQDCLESVVSQIHKVLRISSLNPLLDFLNKDVLDIQSCNDTKRLDAALESVSSFKEEWQQRSWSLYEDLDSILSSLQHLASLIRLADKRVSLAALSKYDYKRLYDMVDFYQMETRSVVRGGILNVLKLVLLLDRKMVSILLPSVLPLEIARDMASQQSTETFLNLEVSLTVLVLLFATAEMLPYTHYDVLNLDFVNGLLGVIECDRASDSCLSLAMKALFSFNLHFEDPESNRVIQSLAAQESSKYFSERLLLMLNKEDALWAYDELESPYPSAVVKLLQDIFSFKTTGQKLFYSNDAAVLVDIVLREIIDLTPGKLRSEYLSLVQLILVQSDIMDSRIPELTDSLKQLDLTDDGSFPKEDYIIMKDIQLQVSSRVQSLNG